jgi:3-phytase
MVFFAACTSESNENKNEVSEKMVTATLETQNTQSVEGEDAADDPAIWYNKNEPEKSLILGTNKRLGLEVYTLEGVRVASYNTGRQNNVDVRYGFQWGERVIDIAAASNRTKNRIDIWEIDADGSSFKLISDTSHRSGLEEVYGFCLYKRGSDSSFHAFVNGKDGRIEQWMLVPDSVNISLKLVKTYMAAGQVEGMIADDETGLLYVGEEDGGIFVYNTNIREGNIRYRIANSGEENADLKYDIEGLTIYFLPDGEGYLLASSQGNNRFAVFERKPKHKYLGYFTIGDGQIDGVKETDGIDVLNMPLGNKFPNGVFICQDGFNTENGRDVPQNFKLVSWDSIAVAFKPELLVEQPGSKSEFNSASF